MKLVYGTSIRGNGHFVSGTECQDSNSFCETDFNEDDIKVIAVSDGHGGTPYFRSSFGSKTAVQIAKECLHEFVKSHIDSLDRIDEISNQLVKPDCLDSKKIDSELMDVNKKISELKPVIDFKREIYNRLSESKKTGDPTCLLTLTEEQREMALEISNLNDFVKELNKTILEYNECVKKQKQLKQLKSDIDNFIRLSGEKEDLVKRVNEDLLDVKKQILERWNQAIDNHLKHNPVQIATIELTKNNSIDNEPKKILFSGFSVKQENSLKMVNKGLDQKMVDEILRNPRELYGATLLCAASYKDNNFIIQIGDGDISILEKDGSVSFPVIKPDGQIANETNSICQLSAIKRFSEAYFKRNIKMIMISTDGVLNALDEINELGKIVSLIYDGVIKEPELLREDLIPLLRKFSCYSDDDCTIGFIADDIDQKTIDIIKNTTSPIENNDLESTYRPKFKSFKLNRNYCSLESGSKSETIDEPLENIFSRIKESVSTSVYDMFKPEIDDLNDSIGELEKTKFVSKRLMNNKKKAIDELKKTLNETFEKMHDKYHERINEIVDKNPFVTMKYDILNISMNDENKLETENADSIYGIVESIDDDTISYKTIRKDTYDSISNNFSKYFKYVEKNKI